MSNRNIIILMLCIISITGANAQRSSKQRLSPLAISNYQYEDTYLKVTYCQPQKKGRTVFGELVPYGEVWRTGANEAPELTVTEDIKINGKELKAGTYTMFTIPGKTKWKIVFNTELGQWGAYEYDPSKDALTLEIVPSVSVETIETFTIDFEPMIRKVHMNIMWDKTLISLPITF